MRGIGRGQPDGMPTRPSESPTLDRGPAQPLAAVPCEVCVGPLSPGLSGNDAGRAHNAAGRRPIASAGQTPMRRNGRWPEFSETGRTSLRQVTRAFPSDHLIRVGFRDPLHRGRCSDPVRVYMCGLEGSGCEPSHPEPGVARARWPGQSPRPGNSAGARWERTAAHHACQVPWWARMRSIRLSIRACRSGCSFP